MDKFDAFEFLIKDKFPVFLESVSRLDSSFPEPLFEMQKLWDSSPRSRIIQRQFNALYQPRYSIQKKETFQSASFIEITKLEINLRKENLLIFDTYKIPNLNNGSTLNELYSARTFYDALNKNCALLDDLNIVRDDTKLQNF